MASSSSNTAIPVMTVSSLTWTALSRLHANAERQGTFILSPVSICVVLAMLAGAAELENEKKIFAQLGTQDDQSLLALVHHIVAPADGALLHVANAVFFDKTVTLSPEYITHLAKFRAEHFQYPRLVSAIDKINGWISDHTLGLVKDMLSQAFLSQSHMVLVNAVAFKRPWEHKFNPNHTKEAAFFTSEQVVKTVDMMYLLKSNIMHRDAETYAAVRLPYVGESDCQSSFVAYLPKLGVSVHDILEVVAAENAGCGLSVDSFSATKYDIFVIPKFDISSSYTMMSLLKQLGFPLDGHFPRMGTGNHLVREVLHEAHVTVDEDGTTAAAATAIAMKKARRRYLNVLVFNRPFVFMIVSHLPNIVLFAGVYSGGNIPN